MAIIRSITVHWGETLSSANVYGSELPILKSQQLITVDLEPGDDEGKIRAAMKRRLEWLVFDDFRSQCKGLQKLARGEDLIAGLEMYFKQNPVCPEVG